MPSPEGRYETPRSRTAWLLLAFALLIGAGFVTVLLPETEDDPSDRATQAAERQEDRTD